MVFKLKHYKTKVLPQKLIFIFMTQHPKIFNLNDITNENNQNHSRKWPYIPDHPYIMLIIRIFRSGKTNALLNLRAR